MRMSSIAPRRFLGSAATAALTLCLAAGLSASVAQAKPGGSSAPTTMPMPGHPINFGTKTKCTTGFSGNPGFVHNTKSTQYPYTCTSAALVCLSGYEPTNVKWNSANHRFQYNCTPPSMIPK